MKFEFNEYTPLHGVVDYWIKNEHNEEEVFVMIPEK